MNLKLFGESLKEIAANHNLTEKAIIGALETAIQKAYQKEIKIPDAEVKVDLDMDTGFVTVAQLKEVRPDEEITDDALQIDYDAAKEDADAFLENLEDEKEEAEAALSRAQAGKKSPKKAKEVEDAEWRVLEIENLAKKVKDAKENIRFGGKYPLYCDIDSLSKMLVKQVYSLLRSQISEAEREALYDVYKDHIGEMETGTVEKADDRSVIVRLRHGVTELTRKELIGDETFKPGDQIKVYIEEVKSSSDPSKPSKGPQVQATRSSEGFLKRLFEEEIREIYDGTIFIMGIARDAGVRSKVAVMSKAEDIDPTGACIGPQGSRIQKIMDQLGHNTSEKEKIDIIAYSPYLPLYVADALRPAEVLGVYLSEEEPEEGKRRVAYLVVEEDQIRKAWGKKRANIRLAGRLTGLHVEVLTRKEAEEKEIPYVRMDELKRLASEEKLRREMAEYAEKNRQETEKKAKLLEEARLKGEEKSEKKEVILPPLEDTYDLDEAEEEAEEDILEEETPLSSKEEKKEEETLPAPEEKEEAPAKQEETLHVATTTTLQALEEELGHTGKKESSSKKKGSKKRPHHISEEEIAHVKPSEGITAAMPIYSKEELEEIEKEEAEMEEEGDSYDDYDFDDYDEYYDEH